MKYAVIARSAPSAAATSRPPMVAKVTATRAHRGLVRATQMKRAAKPVVFSVVRTLSRDCYSVSIAGSGADYAGC